MTDWKTTVVVLNYTLRLLITPLVSLNFINKPYWIPMGQSKKDNPEKMAINGAQDEDKQNKNTTQYMLDITIPKGAQIT